MYRVHGRHPLGSYERELITPKGLRRGRLHFFLEMVHVLANRVGDSLGTNYRLYLFVQRRECR